MTPNESGSLPEQLAFRARESILQRYENRETGTWGASEAEIVAAESLLGGSPSSSFGQSQLGHRQREEISQLRLLRGVARPRVLPGEFVASEGEHVVHYDAEHGIARKATNQGRYGYIVDQDRFSPRRRFALREAMPGEYLWRLGLQNAVFEDVISLDGIAVSWPRPEIHTSQPWIAGNPGAISIELDDVRQFMEDQGFVQVPKGMLDRGNPTVLNWYRVRDEVWVADAKPPNFLRLPGRRLAPIDLIMQVMPLALLRDTALRNGVQWKEIELDGSGDPSV